MESVKGLSQTRRILSTPVHIFFMMLHFMGQSESMARKTEKEVVVVEKPRLRAKPERGTKMRLSDTTKKEAMEAAQYGMPIDRIAILCGFPAGNQTQWHRWISANPKFQLAICGLDAGAHPRLRSPRSTRAHRQRWKGVIGKRSPTRCLRRGKVTPRGDQDPQEGGGCYLYTPSPSHTKFYARQAN
jgi:hypothetical protein